jgi:hypothetical protein
MHKFSALILSSIFVSGTVLALLQLYASADGLQHPLRASLYYLGSAIAMISVLVKFRKNSSKRLIVINNALISIFAVNSIVLALICLYALQPEGRVDSLAGAIFFFAGMVAGSSAFFVRAKANDLAAVSDKYEKSSTEPQAI